MAWMTGVVTYSARKKTKDGKGEYGMISIEGLTMFTQPEFLVPVGCEVRAFVSAQSRKLDDGSYSNNINALSVQIMRMGVNQQSNTGLGQAAPQAQGVNGHAHQTADDIPF